MMACVTKAWILRRCGTSFAILATLSALVSCSGLPRLPCNPFVPCPAPTSRTSRPDVPPSPAPTPTGAEPDELLHGDLITLDGQGARVTTRLQLGTPVARRTEARSSSIQLPVVGSVTVANLSNRYNPAATSVDFEVRAGYPKRSRVCRLDAMTGTRSGSGSYCWLTVPTTVPADSTDKAAYPLAAGESRTMRLRQLAMLDAVPATQARRLVADLVRPSVLVASTAEIAVPGAFRFRHPCRTKTAAPTSPSEPNATATIEHVLLGSTNPVDCSAVRW